MPDGDDLALWYALNRLIASLLFLRECGNRRSLITA